MHFAQTLLDIPYFDNGQNNECRAYICNGSATGINTTPAATLESFKSRSISRKSQSHDETGPEPALR